MFLEIYTPDEKVFEGEVESTILPGTNGEFQILNDHAPLVSSLGLGDIRYNYHVDNKAKVAFLRVDGGVAEVLNNKILVLVESILD